MKKIHFNTDEMTAIVCLAAEIAAESDPNLTTAENLRRSLMRRTSGQTTGVAEDLLSGIALFDGLYRDAPARGSYTIIRTHLQDLLDNSDPERRGVILEGIIRGAYEAVGEEVNLPENMMPAALLEIAISAIEDIPLTAMTSGSTPLGEMDAADTKALFSRLTKAANGNAMAMAAYILHRQGKLPSLPEDATAQQIGAITAGSVAAQTSLMERIQGHVDMDAVVKALKVIAGLTVLALIVIGTPMVLKASVVAVAKFCVGVFGAKMLFMESLLSWMLLGATAGTVLGAATVGACEIAKSAGVTAALGEVWKVARHRICTRIAPAVKEFFATAGEPISETTEPIREKITAARQKVKSEI